MDTVRKDLLPHTELQSTSITQPSSDRRRESIDFIAGLDREGLAYGLRERRLLIARTPAGEEIFIQYPGKESARKKNKRPWDFRPCIRRPGGTLEDDWSFYDIWTFLYTIGQSRQTRELLPAMAAAFYRMAFLLDHETPAPRQLAVFEIDVASGSEREVRCSLPPAPPVYTPPAALLAALQEAHAPQPDSLSWTAFFYLNDLLAWNEDCKYYYRNLERAAGKSKPAWIRETGRPNNLLSHVSVIGLTLGTLDPWEVLQKASRSRGVFAASPEEVLKVCAPYVAK